MAVHKGGRKPLRLRPAQPGGGQRLLDQATGQRGRQKLHREKRARDFEPPGAGGQHGQHGIGGAAATGRSVAQCGGVNVG